MVSDHGSRRGAAGAALPMSALSDGTLLAQEARNSVVWVSPRGTLEVLDDYAYWVALNSATSATSKPRSSRRSWKRPPRPRPSRTARRTCRSCRPASSLAVSIGGIDLVSVFQVTGYDVFDLAMPKGNPQGINTFKDLEGKSMSLGDIGWSGIVDPMIKQAGGDPSKVQYVPAGSSWGQAFRKVRPTPRWHGAVSARNGSPAVSTSITSSARVVGLPGQLFPDPPHGLRRCRARRSLHALSPGLRDGLRVRPHQPTRRDPDHDGAEPIAAALQATFPDKNVAVQSFWELANCRGDCETATAVSGVGRTSTAGDLFDDSAQASGSDAVDAASVIFNDYIDGANAFDAAQVEADSSGYALDPEFAAVAESMAGAEATPAG